MAFYCIFNLKFPQALCFWCWEIAPVTEFPWSTKKCYSYCVVSKDFVFVQSFVRYSHSFNIVIQADKGLLVLGIFRIFPRSSWFIWPCDHLIDTFRIVAWTCIVSLDQETDSMILGCIGKARFEANLWIIYKDGHLRFKRDRCQLFWATCLAVHKLDNASLLRIQLFIRADRDGQVMLEQDFDIASIVFQDLISC